MSNSQSLEFRRERLWGYAFVAPQFIGMALFVVGPVVAAVYLSFTRWNMTSAPQWIGLENYLQQFADPLFLTLIRNTAYLTFAYIPLVVAASLALALLVNNKVPFAKIFRSLYFLPVVTSIVAISIVWKWLLQPEFGLLNYLLGLAGIPGPAWLASRQWAMPGLIMMRVWWGAGYYMVIILAGLKSISPEYYEAARIDGAEGWRQFGMITLPLLSRSLFLVVVMAAIWTLQEFEQVYIMTGGGPADATNVVVLHIYRQAFRYFRMGSAAALSVLLFVSIIVFTFLQFRVASRWVDR